MSLGITLASQAYQIAQNRQTSSKLESKDGADLNTRVDQVAQKIAPSSPQSPKNLLL